MHIYFAGLGGVGIGPLALLAHQAGHQVSGSEPNESRYLNALEGQEIRIIKDQSGEALRELHGRTPVDWYVYTSALPEDHPELAAAQELGIRTSKRDEFLNFIITESGLKLIAVAGTHGKTTTTAMIVWLLMRLDEPVSYSVGTILPFGPPARIDRDSSWFVYEADEFDRNFLHFNPDISVIPSIDFDHPDTYEDQADYDGAFRQFLEQSRRAYMWHGDALEHRLHDIPGVATLDRDDTAGERQKVTLLGEHFKANAVLAMEAVKDALGEKASPRKLHAAINSFPGTDRRLERLADNLYSDYAHHPAEIRATLAAAKELGRPVIAVYQPHQNIRQRELLARGGYGDAFRDAKHVYWLPTYLSREPDTDVVPPEELIATLDDPSKAEISKLGEYLGTQLDCELETHTVVGMSAGSLDAWLRELAAQLEDS